MATLAKRQFNEDIINFYEEQLLPHADTVYRFAFALTLSLDGAAACVRQTYQEVANDLEKFQAAGEANAEAKLIATCWRAYQGAKGAKSGGDQSAITKALKPLSVEARAALTAVDVVGLAPAEAAQAFGWSERDLRVQLAAARRALMMSTLDI